MNSSTSVVPRQGLADCVTVCLAGACGTQLCARRALALNPDGQQMTLASRRGGAPARGVELALVVLVLFFPVLASAQSCECGRCLSQCRCGNADSSSSCQSCCGGSGSPPPPTTTYCSYGQYKYGSSCRTCQEGRYQSSSSHTSTTCSGCPAGKKDRTNRRGCDSCAAGRYDRADRRYCDQCPSGQTSSSGSDSSNDCYSTTTYCSYGQYKYGSSSCRTCQEGRYQSSSSHTSTTCSGCPAGKKDRSNRRGCDSCAAGRYDRADRRYCDQCPSGQTSPSGSDSSNDCYSTTTYCSYGQYKYGSSSCRTCQEGRYRSSSSHTYTTCSECQAGKQDRSNRRGCDSCAAGRYDRADRRYCDQCPSGQTSPSGSDSSNDCYAPAPPTCSGTQTYYSPRSFTGTYANNANCLWQLRCSSSQTVRLDFSSFQMETNFDFVSLFDGSSTSSPRLSRVTGSSHRRRSSSTGRYLSMQLTSDGSVTHSGFGASL